MKYLALLVISMISGLALGENQDPLGLKPKKLILSIGVGEFQDDLWHPLKFAPKDASDVYEKFTKGVGFDGGQLVNGQKVSKEDIEKAIDRLDSSNLNEDDTVIVYVSSHGTILSELGGVSHRNKSVTHGKGPCSVVSPRLRDFLTLGCPAPLGHP